MTELGLLGAWSVTPARSRRLGSFGASGALSSGELASKLGGSGWMSEPWRVSVMVSSTPGRVAGCAHQW
jgi:hypothetical protein